jgi:transcriptional regulator with XRE-family HTH domain
MVKIAQRIIELRKSVGWSQSELARQSAVTSAAISQIEKGNRIPSLTVLKKLAIALNVNLLAFSSEIVNCKESDEKLFFRKFGIINKLKPKDQKLILDISSRLLK